MRFWDASALMPLWRNELATSPVTALLSEDQRVQVWWGTRIECISALSRLVREGRIESPAEAQVRADLGDLFRTADEVEPTEAVRELAERLLRRYPLRAADALQLAAAVTGCRGRTSQADFVSLDQRLREAATGEGFSVLPV